MAKTNCECKRLVGPCGIWSLDDLIGSVVTIASLSVSNFGLTIDSDKKYEVEDIEFRISLDGKAITVVKLKGINNHVFTLKDLNFIGINHTENNEEEE